MVTIQVLNNISQQLNIYCSLFIFIFGIIGALWNILVFRHYSLRLSSYCTYMLFGSITSLIYISFSLFDRIITEGYNIQWIINNIVWCKIQQYSTYCTSFISLTCLVFTSIDRFFSTCRQIKWRHLNSIYVARQICLFITIFWMLLTIPILIYTRPVQITFDKCLCQNSSLIWSKIIVYFFNLCCYGIFPWVFMSLFGCLTLKNLHHIRHHRIGTLSFNVLSRMARIDEQLISILYLQIIICIISSIPFFIQNVYNDVTQKINKNEYRQAQEYLFLQITCLIYYFNYISIFYVNYLSSSIFRQVSKQVLMNLCKKQDDISRDITIINHRESNNNQLDKQNLKIFTVQPNSRI